LHLLVVHPHYPYAASRYLLSTSSPLCESGEHLHQGVLSENQVPSISEGSSRRRAAIRWVLPATARSRC